MEKLRGKVKPRMVDNELMKQVVELPIKMTKTKILKL